MSQNLEIEFKNLLEKVEFDRISRELGMSQSSFRHQVNHYFDTPSFSLKDAGSALRIRVKGDKYVLTLKQPHGDGLLETHQALSKQDAETAIGGGPLPSGQVAGEIEKLFIPFQKLIYFGTLETLRAEINYEDGLLVLDHSLYLGSEDYELEFEAEDFNSGEAVFETILRRFGIPKRNTPNKIRRFYNRKLSLDNECRQNF